jgi:ABC-type Fe3+-siderophore transport system permease subunit
MELGAKFWLGVVAFAIGAGLVAVLAFLIFGWAWYAWGFLGAFLFFAVVALGIAWVVDKRDERRYRDVSV